MRALLLLVLLSAPTARAQVPGTWSLLPNSPSASRWDDASFIDPDTGWVVTMSSSPPTNVYATTDGGDTWEARGMPTTESGARVGIRTVTFLSATHGFAGTLSADHLLYETTDGGRTWVEVDDRITGPRPSGICGMWAVSDQLLYATGAFWGPAHFLTSTDGGQTWVSRDMSAYASGLVDVYFWDGDRGIAVGSTGSTEATRRAVVLMTEDGGDTWTARHTASASATRGWKISFPTPTTGYVSVEGSGAGSGVLQTTDGGLTWSERPVPGSSLLQGVGFATESVGWVGGHDRQARVTTDGGATWQDVAAPNGSTNRFEFFGDTLGYAMGERVYRYRRVAAAVEPPPSADAPVLAAPTPNPAGGPVTLAYRLATSARVRLTVYDALGREVAVVAAGERAAGVHAATWDAAGAAPGRYLVRLEADGATATRPVTVRRAGPR